ncbi:hypothetical protein [Endozoicomonas sp. ALC066]|uniref:hypothetical protein n=1 Tax=Endozoicomonas sp. ALC066 TaxID=3403078 RepID=UPI003BB494ED
MRTLPLYLAAGISYLLTLNLFVSTQDTHWNNLIGFGLATLIEYCKYRAFARCMEAYKHHRTLELRTVGIFAGILLFISLSASMATLSGHTVKDERIHLQTQIAEQRIRAAETLNDVQKVSTGSNPTLDKAEQLLASTGQLSTLGTLAKVLSQITGLQPNITTSIINLIASLVVELSIVFLLYENRHTPDVIHPHTPEQTVYEEAHTPDVIHPEDEEEEEYEQVIAALKNGDCTPGPRPIATHFDLKLSKSQKIVRRLTKEGVIEKNGNAYKLAA